MRSEARWVALCRNMDSISAGLNAHKSLRTHACRQCLTAAAGLGELLLHCIWRRLPLLPFGHASFRSDSYVVSTACYLSLSFLLVCFTSTSTSLSLSPSPSTARFLRAFPASAWGNYYSPFGKHRSGSQGKRVPHKAFAREG